MVPWSMCSLGSSSKSGKRPDGYCLHCHYHCKSCISLISIAFLVRFDSLHSHRLCRPHHRHSMLLSGATFLYSCDDHSHFSQAVWCDLEVSLISPNMSSVWKHTIKSSGNSPADDWTGAKSARLVFRMYKRASELEKGSALWYELDNWQWQIINFTQSKIIQTQLWWCYISQRRTSPSSKDPCAAPRTSTRLSIVNMNRQNQSILCQVVFCTLMLIGFMSHCKVRELCCAITYVVTILISGQEEICRAMCEGTTTGLPLSLGLEELVEGFVEKLQRCNCLVII